MAACKAITSIFGSRSSLLINNSRRQFLSLTSAFGTLSTLSENKYIKKIKNDRQIHVSRSCLDASKDIKKARRRRSANKYLCDTDKNNPEAKKKFQVVDQVHEALKDNENNIFKNVYDFLLPNFGYLIMICLLFSLSVLCILVAKIAFDLLIWCLFG